MFRPNIINVVDFAEYVKNVGEEHKNLASALRKKAAYQNIETLTVKDLSFFPSSNEHPIMFDDIYVSKDSKIAKPKIFSKASSQQKFEN
jgi:hypothetical protein